MIFEIKAENKEDKLNYIIQLQHLKRERECGIFTFMLNEFPH